MTNPTKRGSQVYKKERLQGGITECLCFKFFFPLLEIFKSGDVGVREDQGLPGGYA